MQLVRAAIFHTPDNSLRLAIGDRRALVCHEDGGLLVDNGRIAACGDYTGIRDANPRALRTLVPLHPPPDPPVQRHTDHEHQRAAQGGAAEAAQCPASSRRVGGPRRGPAKEGDPGHHLQPIVQGDSGTPPQL